jgi:dihydroorotase
MRIIIQGGHVIDPANDIDKVQDIYIADGKILARGRQPQDFQADRIIDAEGLVVCPGLVDLRARLREPGQENKATIASETKAAAKAGVTTICCPPDTDPVIDTPAVVELIHRRAAEAGCANIVPLGALTHQLRGEQLAEMSALKHAGCMGVSNALQPVDPKILRRAMEYAASQGLTVYIHPEDPALSQTGCAHEGTVSVRLGLPGIPETAETVAVAQALQLIDLTGVNAHFCQLSSAAAARMIARAQYDGAPITVDVTSHHLFLTEMDIGYFNAQCHVRPPLRTQRDRDGLREALVNGTISAICSDHQPHDTDAKLAPFPATEPGISAIETLLPLTLRLVDDGLLSLPDALSRVTFFPANILEISAGTLDIGASADICVFHPHYCWRYEESDIVSAGKNTPFLGWNLKGFVTHTLLNGRIVHEADEATLHEVMAQGAYEAELAQSRVVPEVEPAEDEDFLPEEDEEPWLEAEPAPVAEAPAPQTSSIASAAGKSQEKISPEATQKSTAEATPQPPQAAPGKSKQKKKTAKKIVAEPEESEPGIAETETGETQGKPKSTPEPVPQAKPEQTPAPAPTTSYSYKRPVSPYRVPPKQFAPLSDRVIKTKPGDDNGAGEDSGGKQAAAKDKD